MWTFHLCLVILKYCVDRGTGLSLYNSKFGETEIFNRIANCINNISDAELQYRPTVAIDTQNIKNATKGNILMEKVISKLMENKIPILIIANDISSSLLDNILIIKDDVFKKKNFVHALLVVFLETCNDVTTFGLKKKNKEVKHLIIIFDPSSNNCIDKLQEIRNFVFKYDVTFVLLDILLDQNKMLTFIPKIDQDTCKEVADEPIHINTCSYGTLQSNVVFPSKNPTNLNKCPFRIGMATLFPFSEVKDKELLKTYDSINETKGSDLVILKIVAKYFNATLDLHFIYRLEESPYGQFEFLKFLMNGSLDVCAGGLYRIYGDIVEYSGIYARQAVVWIYYAERVDRSWENLVGKVNGLYFFVIFYVIYSVIWYLICVYDGDAVSLKNTFLYGWGALVGATSLQDARSMKQKILNLGFLVISIHLSAYISIQLYSFLTIRAPPKMFSTNDEIMDSGRVPFLISTTKYFVNDKRYLEFANTSAECVSFVDCAEKTLEHNGLTIVLQGNFYDFQSATAVNGEARILRAAENVLTVYNEMIIRKDIPLVAKFQRVMQSLFEAGIVERLYNEAIGILVMAKADSANSNMVASSYSCQAGCSITFMQIAGVFYVWIFGCVISCVVFILEICSKREMA